MNLQPFTRRRLANQFFKLQTRAIQEALEAICTEQPTRLATLPDNALWMIANRRSTGVQEIPLEKIVGTFNRNRNFDRKFHPVKRHMQDRWINAALRLKKDNLTPIVVHKVGEEYYVEDGHQRVSAARSLGRKSIKAKVWDYPVDQTPPMLCVSEACAERSSKDTYCMC